MGRQDVLVERLTAADTQPETAAQLNGGGGGGLRDDRGMHPERRAGDGGGDGQCRDLGQRAQNAPDERTLALFVVPRVEVIRYPQRVKTGFLGSSGLRDQVVGIELFAAEEITDMRHVGRVPGKPGRQSRWRVTMTTATCHHNVMSETNGEIAESESWDVAAVFSGGDAQHVGSFQFHLAEQRWVWSEAVARMHGYALGRSSPPPSCC